MNIQDRRRPKIEIESQGAVPKETSGIWQAGNREEAYFGQTDTLLSQPEIN
ncbi:MAG: hypothetical protein CM15mV40_090 [Caudoviricetes sp.]|nr:MAG: hypothetical protein CM15mV40_090 [Caudoviricetes sp.]